GCRDTLQAVVTPLPVPDTPIALAVVNLCQFQSPVPLTAKASPGHQLFWYASATGGTASTVAPRPPTSTPGSSKFYVSQKALFGCEGFRREITVNVISTPVASFTVNNPRQCQNGNSFIFTSSSTNLNKPSYTWDFGDGQTYSSTDSFSLYSYTSSKNFTVRMKATNANTCTAERTQNVTVVPLPIASFTFPSLICENQTPVLLTDQSTVPAGIASINNWWWNVNGKILQGQRPPSTTAPGGSLSVKLVVTTVEGCRSDTSSKTLDIRFAPLPAFGIGDLMCNNETIRFSDQSSMPPTATGEMVSKWYWTFNNSTITGAQNPSTYFSAGIHSARLIAESRAGCKSAPLERSFEIYPKPVIQLDINDSCVFVPITYTASDLSGNAIKWDWDFGNGFRARPTSMLMTYNREGSRPLTLFAQTGRGCKDTFYRPFTIFDNKSFAGKDTVAAMGEPVQLTARGELNMRYIWSPPVGLDHSDIEKPIATLDRDQIY
ncbi:MAG: PKD domain-containing protein, partial [Chitinophagaceae bacterium]